MSNIAIRVEGLGKMYRIGAAQNGYRTFRETLTDAFTAPYRRARNLLRGQAYGAAGLDETIWALKDVSFEVQHGEVVGIIGRNGAGKSTLLKVLSRITEPTEGYADVYGRVGSLLEVGTGFHPELTGRENIYLNGAILGMSRQEIDRKFDEIVDFAGVERFIDTPVKHYSSGMRLRLGFSVAAHLEPEILVVDEVLAVGDAEFQKKCLGKMSDVASEGRTVLFVSHNMAAVSGLCRRAILLDNGAVIMNDSTDRVISAYFKHLDQLFSDIPLSHRQDRTGDGQLKFIGFRAYSIDDNPTLVSGVPAVFELEYEALSHEILHNVTFSIHVEDRFKGRLLTLYTEWRGQTFETLPPKGKVVCEIPRLPLAPGIYRIGLGSRTNNSITDYIENAVEIDVKHGDFFGTGKSPKGNRNGPVLVDHTWHLETF